MSEKLKFYKGLEGNLVNIIIELGAIYHCIDTGNTYIGVIDSEGEVLEDGTYPLKLDLYSTVSDIYISDDEIEGGFELVNADTLGGFPADEYALKDYVYEKIDEININNYATKEEVNALTYEDVGAAPAGDYATKDNLNTIDFPVDSVNGKTGVVELIAEDVGAPTIEYAKKVGAPHNLLDNSYWKNPYEIIMQNGLKPSYGVWGGITIDRWWAGANGIASFIRYDASIGFKGDIFQRIRNPERLGGKRLTFAVSMIGQIFCCSGTVSFNNQWARVARDVRGDVGIEINVQDNNELWVNIFNAGANEVYLEWAALYEGEYTAETLPEYQPKGYEQELLTCRQYDPKTGEYIGLRKMGYAHNLLDNSDFRNPVNQRGAVTGVQWNCLIDRWMSANSDITVTAEGIRIPPGGVWFYQNVPISVYERTKTTGLTGAIKLSSGEIIVGYYGVQATASDGTILRIHNDTQESERFQFRVMSAPNGSTVEWAALYEGVYTAETLPEYQPKGYAAELAECQRYYRAFDRECIGNGYVAVDGKSVILHIPFTMRIPQPTVVWSDTLYCRVNGTDYTVTSARVFNTDNCMRVALYASGMPAKHVAAVWGTSLFALNADL